MPEITAPGIYIIAEAGINHDGDLEKARQMVRVAAAAGVNAVKFQSFTARGLTHELLAADQFGFFSKFELSRDEHSSLAEMCRSESVDFLSTPFDFEAADMLAELGVPGFKIASCDLDNLPLISHCAAYCRSMYISTGMGSRAEVCAAHNAAQEGGASRVVMLQCTTSYPTPYSDVNLKSMQTIGADVDGEFGFSDHSVGNYACFGAAALGASVIEKHFCMDKSATGPDIACSCDPAELADLVLGIRAIETCLGSENKQCLAGEQEVSAIARRSIYYKANLETGHVVSPADLTYLRPAGGLSPARSDQVIGRQLNTSVVAGQAVELEHLD